MKLPTIKRKLPKVFTDENNYFGQNQSWIDTWHSCNTCATYCALLAIPAIYFQWWWGLPILAFIGLMASMLAGSIEQKAGTGYPYLEHTDAMGLGCGGIILFVLFFAAFIGSFYLPNDGWGDIFTGPSSSEFSATVNDGDTNE
jgi:hypothetical protein